jgi:low molecular weight protein-tyrosine phosphatase
MGDPAHVLCVCTANVCRSSAAELLLRAGLRARLGSGVDQEVVVTSAGTWATPGRPVEPGTAGALRRAGVDPAEVAAARSTRLTPEAVAGADLIIGSTAEHVRGVWRLQLASRHRAFTLGELARLTEGIPGDDLPPATRVADRLRALVARASTLREQRLRPGMPYVTDAYDLEDPTDNDPAQRDMVGQTAAWVDFVLDTVAGPAPARRGYRDRVPGVARALQWSRHRAARGAIR